MTDSHDEQPGTDPRRATDSPPPVSASPAKPESGAVVDADTGTPPSPATPPADGLLASVFAGGNPCFTDQHGQPYWSAPVADPEPHVEVLPVESVATERWLIRRGLDATGLPPAKEAIRDLKWVMSARSLQGARRPLHNRFAWDGDNLWIDFADDRWRAIRVTAGGWGVVASPPPLFRRYPHQLPLVEPERGGSLTELTHFLPPMSEADGLLCCAWAALACVPTIARPILIPIGQHGAGKTNASLRLKSLIDPSLVPLLGEDHRRDLLLTLDQHAIPVFDNLAPFRRNVADLFCRVVTGGGTYRRKLYTDTDGVILSFRRAVILNGLQVPSARPDFLDRSLTIGMRRFETFRPEREIQAEFAAAAPRLLGAVLDTLSACLQTLGSVPEPHSFRLADFARWGRAVAVTLGRTAGDFDAAYRAALDRQGRDVVETDPVALAVVEYATRNESLLPQLLTADDFFTAIATLAKELRLHGPEWPEGKGAMSVRLGELIPTLAALGFRLTKLDRTNKVRSRWQLEQVTAGDGG